tara:strand:+ start:2828 stop:3175 length:348 start_codon:yes stop_codon:yes gene_type:complete
MKTEVLKKLIKEAVKEAIQDELKDILLEAVKAPKTQVVRESIQPVTSPPPSPKPTYTEPTMDVKQKYANIIGETAISMTSKDVSSFNPQGVDPINGDLGSGEVKMNTIMGLLNSK